MRDCKFGFSHLEQGARSLGLSPVEIPFGNRHDLSDLLFEIYGPNYSTDPKLQTLAQMNGIEPRDWLTREQEVQAFRRGEFGRLHFSTLRKVEVVHELASLAFNRRLRTLETRWRAHARTIFREWPTIRSAIDLLSWARKLAETP